MRDIRIEYAGRLHLVRYLTKAQAIEAFVIYYSNVGKNTNEQLVDILTSIDLGLQELELDLVKNAIKAYNKKGIFDIETLFEKIIGKVEKIAISHKHVLKEYCSYLDVQEDRLTGDSIETYLLNQIKEDCLLELVREFRGYSEANFSPESWKELEIVYNEAKNKIKNARLEKTVRANLQVGKDKMALVPAGIDTSVNIDIMKKW